MSSGVCLLIGHQCASVVHLLDLIENQSKIDHGLVMSDVYIQDKENYSSCEKISSNAVCLSQTNSSIDGHSSLHTGNVILFFLIDLWMRISVE